MKLFIETQVEENYGAHDWDGEGQCPQYWKFKGGNEYSYQLGNSLPSVEHLKELVEALRSQFEVDNEGYREYLVSWEVVADDHLSWFEKSQLEQDGVIAYATRKLTLPEVSDEEYYSPYITINS
jgi:hypothetical protein